MITILRFPSGIVVATDNTLAVKDGKVTIWYSEPMNRGRLPWVMNRFGGAKPATSGS